MSVSSLAVACRAAAIWYRVGEEAAGSAELKRLTEQFIALAGAGDARVLGLLPALQELVAAQGRGDFLRVADLLEFALAPALRS